jgi:valyl-tRNA synthetase
MLGDTAVAVHPKDERYMHLIGKTITLPVVNRQIPIIGDDYVEQEFGTGAVKITPAHDPNDFEVGKRHNLPQILVMREDGRMNENAGPYVDLDRFECRDQLVSYLEEIGVLVKIEEHVHQVGHSERSGAVIEPYLSTQWFVKMKPLADAAIERQKSGKGVTFVPDRFEKTYLNWIENIHDWCISRQLWWGHRIPAWYCEDCNEVSVAKEDVTVCQHCGSSHVSQDNDVLDTWFSSALWPFSTMGWPEQTEDLARYYPTNVLVTGYDIIYFWVARMIFTALNFTNENPFKDVLIHGLVRDADGRKMSKSLGNGVDPIEIIDQYGADALRFMLSTGSTPGQDLRFRLERVEQARNFANKIWNASRFVLMNVEGVDAASLQIDWNGPLTSADKWIVHRLNETIADVTRLMDAYDFGETGRKLYDFIWDDLCDWYIEFAKLTLYGQDEIAKKQTQAVLVYVLDQTLRLLHPFMPFISEEIREQLPVEGETTVLAKWPVYDAIFEAPLAVKEMNTLMEAIRAVRNVRAEVNVPMSKKIELMIRPATEEALDVFHRNMIYIERFAAASKLDVSSDLVAPDKAMTSVIADAELYFPLAGLIDIEQEIARLHKEVELLNGEVSRIEGKLGNEGFVAKAPARVIEEEKEKLKMYSEKREKVIARITELKG